MGGSFIISIRKKWKCKLGWQVQPIYQIKLHIRNEQKILNLQQFFKGIGYVNKKNNWIKWTVSNLKDLTNIIIPHFKKYSLLTQKGSRFSFI